MSEPNKESEKVKQSKATVCFLVKDNQVLLCLKKKESFGHGYLVGPGGKIEVGETSEQCVVRETREEIKVAPKYPEKSGTIIFNYSHDGIPEIQEVDFYIAKEWEGDPVETDEMKPEWFDIDKVPYDRMLPTNQKFIEPMLHGKKVNGAVIFDEDFNPLSSQLVVSD